MSSLLLCITIDKTGIILLACNEILQKQKYQSLLIFKELSIKLDSFVNFKDPNDKYFSSLNLFISLQIFLSPVSSHFLLGWDGDAGDTRGMLVYHPGILFIFFFFNTDHRHIFIISDHISHSSDLIFHIVFGITVKMIC